MPHPLDIVDIVIGLALSSGIGAWFTLVGGSDTPLAVSAWVSSIGIAKNPAPKESS